MPLEPAAHTAAGYALTGKRVGILCANNLECKRLFDVLVEALGPHLKRRCKAALELEFKPVLPTDKSGRIGFWSQISPGAFRGCSYDLILCDIRARPDDIPLLAAKEFLAYSSEGVFKLETRHAA